MSLFSIIVDIGARTANIEESLSRVEGRLTSFGNAVKGLGGIIGAGAFVEFGKKIIDLGFEIEGAAKKAGVTTTAFQELAYAAKQSGVQSGALDTALIHMNRAMSLASTGGKQQTDTLRALGLTFEQLKNLAPDKQFELLVDRISQLATAADKARAEWVLFGRSAGESGALFDNTAESIRKLRNEAETNGGVIGEKALKQLEEAHKAVDRLETSWSAFAATLMGKVAPSLTYALDQLRANRLEIGEKAAMSKMGEDFSWLEVLTTGTKKYPHKSEAPGFAATQIPDLSVHPTLKGQKVGKIGMDALLQQWNEETVGIENRAEAIYDMSMLKLKELLNAGVIGLEDFTQRAHEAGVKYNAVFDELQPVIITAKKVIDTAGVEAALNRFTDDMKGALDKTAHESGNFGKNLLYNILRALEDRAIFAAIEEIGAYLAQTLAKATAGASGTGFWGELLSAAVSIYGGSTAGAGGTGSAGMAGGFTGGRASGGFVASRKTYMVGERGPELFTPSGSGNITPSDQLGGGGFTFAPNYYINAPNGDQQLRNALPGLLAQTAARTKRDMLDAFRRNNLPSPRTA